MDRGRRVQGRRAARWSSGARTERQAAGTGRGRGREVEEQRQVETMVAAAGCGLARLGLGGICRVRATRTSDRPRLGNLCGSCPEPTWE